MMEAHEHEHPFLIFEFNLKSQINTYYLTYNLN